MLELFDKHGISVTWAIVGMLFCKSKNELFDQVPEAHRPKYKDPKQSNFYHAQYAGANESEDPFHYAPSVIRKIQSYSNHEIGTHTYSHYYCLEEGQTAETFRHDLKAARSLANEYGVEMRSIVFPRNQCNDEYLTVCKEEGIRYYRGTQLASIFKPASYGSESRKTRALRLADAYLKFYNRHSFNPKSISHQGGITNIPQSRFLRPWSSQLSFLEPIRLRRIKNEMTEAASNGELYHLWWHPHNFGANLEKNIQTLNIILTHYHTLNDKYGMINMTMQQAGDYLNSLKNQ